MPCSGRTQRSVAAPPAHRLGPGKFGDDALDRLARTSAAAGPAAPRRRRAPRRALRAARGVRPVLRRNPSSACGGARARGPLISSRLASVSLGDVARDQHQPPRRRMNVDRAVSSPAAAVHSANSRASSLRARACIRAGISSEQQLEQEVGHDASLVRALRCGLPPRLAHARLRQIADAADVGLALGDRDHAARLQRVEHMARLDRLLIGRDRQLGLEAALALRRRPCGTGRTAPRCPRPRNYRPTSRPRSRGTRRRSVTPASLNSRSNTLSTPWMYIASRSSP